MRLTQVNTMPTQMTTQKDKPISMDCNVCGYEWDYTGKKEYPAFVTCPGCNNKTRLNKEQD